MRSLSCGRLVAGWLTVLGMVAAVSAQATDRFAATTINMDPSGEELRIDLLRWSSDAERRAAYDVVARVPVESGEEGDLPELTALPTLGYVWPSTGAVGYSVKYAHRVEGPDGSERVTLITDKPLGRYGRASWRPSEPAEAYERPFSVVELRLDQDGNGQGKMSVASDIVFHEDSATVTIHNYESQPVLLTAVERRR